MSVREAIEIPPEAREPKPWFKERPGTETVREIKEFVTKTGKPYLWRGHTHTKPPQNAPVEYRGEFDLPESCKVRMRWAPCPCCCPEHPKYRFDGKIAWFPEEAVIRLIGHDCFKTLNPEGHEQALSALRVEQQRERDTHYLITNLPIVPQMLRVVGAAIPVATAIDVFRADLRAKLEKTLQLKLWPHMRDGQLRVQVRRREVRKHRDGSEQIYEVDDFETFAHLDGYDLLNPRLQRFLPRLNTISERLSEILFDDPEAAIATLADDERQKIAKTLGYNLDRIRNTFNEMDAVRRFVSPATVATLRRWGAHDGSPITLHVERAGDNFYIGKRKEEQLRVEVTSEIDASLPEPPSLGQSKR